MKKRILMCAAGICLLCIVIFTVIIVKSTSEARQYTEQMELGERYLTELAYESAIVAYTTAIEIDPKCEEAYIQLAEVYVATDDSEKALQILEEGYQQTASEAIQAKIVELKERISHESSDNTAENNATVQPTTELETTKAEPEYVDHVMDWQDEKLEKAMREITGIWDRDIMLSDVWDMTELHLEIKGISNISALGEMVNLETLSLGTNNISDISALSRMLNLDYLHLSGNNITDINALSGLVNLERLWLSDNNIADISALSGMTKMKELDLGNDGLNDLGNIITDINALSDMTNLRKLDLGNMEGYIEYPEIYLGGNNITDISALAKMSELEELNLWRNNVSDISALEELKNLRQVVVVDNPIRDLSPVSHVEDVLY